MKKKNDVKIRKASLKDAEKLVELLVNFAFQQEKSQPFVYRKNFKKPYLDYVKECLSQKGNFALVAEENKETVGFLVGIYEKAYPEFNFKKFGFIDELFIVKGYRHKGIGEKLIKEAGKIFKKNGASYYYLHCYPKNANALKFYKTLGFKEFEKILVKKL